ncbi:MAG: phosphoribosylaminoimidazolesuccinocarboxamide synthase [Actinomycetota bacterium]
MNDEAVIEIDLPLPRVASGKVREVFELSENELVFVATDRISAFDVVMAQGIPGKGSLLTSMSLFWFDLLADICPNHLISSYDTRSMVVRKLDMLPIEFVIRGYLVGSGWKEYQTTGSVCGIPLPSGLREADQLPEPIFTPATKAEVGAHDENISEDMAADIVGPDVLKTARDYAIELYARAASHAAERGIILADTKFEFGFNEGVITLADEVLTPDSSRFWPAHSYKPGANPPSYDKQYLRDWLDAKNWDRQPPPPDLPADVIKATAAKYQEAFDAITKENP